MSPAVLPSAVILEALKTVEIRPEALGDLVDFLLRHRFDLSRTVVLCGPGPSKPYGATVERLLRSAGSQSSLRTEGDGRVDSAEALADELSQTESTLVVAVGGGRVLDVAKLAAFQAGLPMVAVPTSLAHDGVYSPVASLTSDGVRRSLGTTAPAALLLDTALLASAPAVTRRAGVGDLLSNITAVLDWRLADRCGSDPFLTESADLALGGVHCYVDVAWSSSTLERVTGLARGLVLSGLAMSAAGTSRPCSGAEHLVSHSLDELLGQDARPHGEQVALGTLLSLAAHDVPDDLVRVVFQTVGLATSPAHLGLSEQLFRVAIERAPQCRPGRYTVLSEVSLRPDRITDLMRRAYR